MNTTLTTKTQTNDFTFGQLFIQSIKVTFSKISVFLPLIILSTALSYATNFIGNEASSMLMSKSSSSLYLIFLLLITVIILSIVIGTLFSLSIIYTSSQTLKNKNLTVQDALRFSANHLFKALGIMLRTFWYIAKVAFLPILIVLILFTIYNYILSASVSGFTQLLSSGDHMIGLENESSTIMPIINYLLSFAGVIAMFLVIFFGIQRATRSIFALYTMVEDNLSGKEALEKSINTVKGNFGRVFGYLLLEVIIVSTIILALSIITLFINETAEYIFVILSTIVATLFSATNIVFLNSLYLKLRK